MKYTVGDRVRVRDDLCTERKYGNLYYCSSDMLRFRGQIAIITKVDSDSYAINKDNGLWNWTDEMLEPVEFTKADLKPGDILTTRNGRIFAVDENDLLGDGFKHEGILESEFDIVKVERPQVVWERSEEVKKTNEELHREMWNWLAEHPEKSKSDWFNDNGYIAETSPQNLCFACAECEEDCAKCPLDERVIGCRVGLFDIWYGATNTYTKARLAKIIANLPWRKVDEK